MQKDSGYDIVGHREKVLLPPLPAARRLGRLQDTFPLEAAFEKAYVHLPPGPLLQQSVGKLPNKSSVNFDIISHGRSSCYFIKESRRFGRVETVTKLQSPRASLHFEETKFFRSRGMCCQLCSQEKFFGREKGYFRKRPG
jgi:hypothetical protein